MNDTVVGVLGGIAVAGLMTLVVVVFMRGVYKLRQSQAAQSDAMMAATRDGRIDDAIFVGIARLVSFCYGVLTLMERRSEGMPAPLLFLCTLYDGSGRQRSEMLALANDLDYFSSSLFGKRKVERVCESLRELCPDSQEREKVYLTIRQFVEMESGGQEEGPKLLLWAMLFGIRKELEVTGDGTEPWLPTPREPAEID